MQNPFPHLMSPRTSRQATSVWTNPARDCTQRYAAVFILAITGDIVARTTVETDVASVATARGLRATRSVDVYPISLVSEGGPSKEDLWAKIQALGCDAIFTVSLLNVMSEQRHVLGMDAYYGGFGVYYRDLRPIVASPGYYTTEKKYFLEGNLFDAATGQIQWSMQSIAYDPIDLDVFSKEYALLLVDQLNQANRLQP